MIDFDEIDKRTPYERHIEAGHKCSSRHSPNGHEIIEECDQCCLAWLMPNALNGWDRPLTLWRYWFVVRGLEAK